MMTSRNALVVPTRLTQPVHIRPIDLDETALQKIASGGVGLLAGTDWHVYLDSSAASPTTNPRAEVLIREAGIELDGTIQGTALFLGRDRVDGECDAPRHLIRLAEQLFDMPLAA
ncbi:hypothetical protein PV772_01125 [Pseudarthrobacter sp. CC12]|uniref:hypothetical protein n=1 Tax=unclassified Pseudarthrobacter TaxID=2647000 RepID=UPI00113200FA|nr:hypothetical protein [Pseudarthrobacter sp. NIBRBAC000502771]QDG62245.1 hypothetical protein NIBR502771_07895 [Pseudarthrobacter sp. NIBRBAC000502771]